MQVATIILSDNYQKLFKTTTYDCTYYCSSNSLDCHHLLFPRQQLGDLPPQIGQRPGEKHYLCIQHHVEGDQGKSIRVGKVL